MLRASRLLLAAVLMLVSTQVYAWNRIGHMAVAGIAFDKLTPAEQEKLVEILKHLLNSDRMLAGLGANPTPRDIVMGAATWPDLIKGDSARYFHNGYNEPGPLESISAAAGEKNGKLPMHKGWHFIDLPYHIDTKVDGPPLDDKVVNIVQVLTVLNKQLRQPTDNPQEQAYEIAWLLHLVGDLHQPLHCAQGFDPQNPTGDVGGNNIITNDSLTHEKELHAYWDDILGKDTVSKKKGQLRLDLDAVKASSVISTIGRQSVHPSASDVDFQKWAAATHKLAVDDAYGELHFTVVELQHGEKEADTVTIDDDYHAMATRISQKQVYLAGSRLAVLLKAYLN